MRLRRADAIASCPGAGAREAPARRPPPPAVSAAATTVGSARLRFLAEMARAFIWSERRQALALRTRGLTGVHRDRARRIAAGQQTTQRRREPPRRGRARTTSFAQRRRVSSRCTKARSRRGSRRRHPNAPLARSWEHDDARLGGRVGSVNRIDVTPECVRSRLRAEGRRRALQDQIEARRTQAPIFGSRVALDTRGPRDPGAELHRPKSVLVNRWSVKSLAGGSCLHP